MSHITIFGEMLVDQFDTGPVVGGAPFNVARHLAAFGHAPLMLSAVGEDDTAQRVLAEARRFGMRCDGIQITAAHPTGVVDIQSFQGGGHAFTIRTGSAWDHIGLAPAQAVMTGEDRSGWLYMGTLALRGAISRQTQLALMQTHRGPRYVDVNWRDGHVEPATALQAIELADVLKVNDDELAMLCGWLGLPAPGPVTDAQALEEAGRALLDRLSLRMLLVTLGAAGAMVIDGQGATHCRSARPVRLVDTVGAGDSFSAAMLNGFLRGWRLHDTLERATEFAGRICEIQGAVPADLARYAQWTRDWPGGA